MQAVRFAVDGRVLDAAPSTSATTGLHARLLVALPDRFIVAWNDLPGGANDIPRRPRDARRPRARPGQPRHHCGRRCAATRRSPPTAPTSSAVVGDGLGLPRRHLPALDRDLTALGALGVHADLRYLVWRLAWTARSTSSRRLGRASSASTPRARHRPAFRLRRGAAPTKPSGRAASRRLRVRAANAPFGLQRYASTGARLGRGSACPELYRYDNAPRSTPTGARFSRLVPRPVHGCSSTRLDRGSLVDNRRCRRGRARHPAGRGPSSTLDGRPGVRRERYGMSVARATPVNLGTVRGRGARVLRVEARSSEPGGAGATQRCCSNSTPSSATTLPGAA